MSNRQYILSDVAVESWDSPNGGQQRTLQLRELVNAIGYEIAGLPVLSGVSNLRRYAAGINCCLRLRLWGRVPARRIRHHGTQWLRFQTALAERKTGRLLLWQISHRNNLSLPFIARHYGYKVVAAPQNLEALVPTGAKFPSARLPELTAEAVALRSCDAVTTIAREESWLLAALGVAAPWLPYQPAAPLRKTLLAVRSQRLATPGADRWLMLGTADNVPTRLGMERVIEMLKASAAGRAIPLDVAGRGTESLRPLVANTACRVLGSLEAGTLQELWSAARGLLVHQTSGAGALTRIRDALWAALPVIANEVAARSYNRAEGVTCYASPTGLLKLLQSQPEIPPLPTPDREAEAHFQETVKRLLTSAG